LKPQFFQTSVNSDLSVTIIGYIFNSSGLKSGLLKISASAFLSSSGVLQSRFGIICATTLNQASFKSLVAFIDSLFQCHLLFNSFILSIVV
jgi:hypothetical protein